jgi:hypothetical protein
LQALAETGATQLSVAALVVTAKAMIKATRLDGFMLTVGERPGLKLVMSEKLSWQALYRNELLGESLREHWAYILFPPSSFYKGMSYMIGVKIDSEISIVRTSSFRKTWNPYFSTYSRLCNVTLNTC